MASRSDPPTASPEREREARWEEEAEFFDARAPGEARGIPPRVAMRYARSAHAWFNKEYRFRILGPLHGHRVLDVGCGTGDNAILLALAGGEVTGVDLSQRSIEVAEKRARASGLPRPPRFVCAPIESADLPERHFDVIWADGLLHHVIPELELVLARLHVLACPGARVVFSEPVNRLPALRALRMALPIPIDGTSGERPLEDAELAVIRRHVSDLRIRAFGLFGRLNRFVVTGGYEEAPLARRAVANLLCAADYAILSAGPLARIGGMAVLHGRFA
ncbi:MAG TPA: class I SAM-dependent methyltransferase [Anaeromyxobacter sp.]|nr:class I SAM-dependent methyltransferase [Anaeromyxobacter sp.]